MSKEGSLVTQRDKLALEMEQAIKRRDYIKSILLDPKLMDKFLADRVSVIIESIAELDVTDSGFARSYCCMQARIGEINQLRADLHMPDNNCKELQARINELNAQIDSRKEINKREMY